MQLSWIYWLQNSFFSIGGFGDNNAKSQVRDVVSISHTSKSNTRFKLEEAGFFLDRAEQNQQSKNFFVFYMDAFFIATASIRIGDGVMVNEYQRFQGFNNWCKQAFQKLESDFPQEFWVKKTRHSIIHLVGNIGYQTRRRVEAGLLIESSGRVRRYDPPPDNRWRFGTQFDKKEGGNVIVDRCRDYLTALTQMVDDWENNHLKLP